jgi:diguanylate cyclase (GGDEF)-like protein
MEKVKTLRPESLPVLGAALACLFWFIDSAVATFIFKTQRLYLENLLSPDPVGLWTRCQVVILLMAFSMLCMLMLSRHLRMRQQLTKYKCEIEQIVDQRMEELCRKNTLLKAEITQRQKMEKELVELATIDPLTAIANRRKFDEALQYELNRDSRYRQTLSIIFCDLDYFKKINDQHGHKIGDDALREFASLISSHTRNTDIVARWGGEEFVLLLPETDINKAASIAEKLRTEIENNRFSYVGKITASFGVTEFVPGDNDISFIKRADDALYRAKENGRNRVEIMPPPKISLRTLSAV